MKQIAAILLLLIVGRLGAQIPRYAAFSGSKNAEFGTMYLFDFSTEPPTVSKIGKPESNEKPDHTNGFYYEKTNYEPEFFIYYRQIYINRKPTGLRVQTLYGDSGEVTNVNIESLGKLGYYILTWRDAAGYYNSYTSGSSVRYAILNVLDNSTKLNWVDSGFVLDYKLDSKTTNPNRGHIVVLPRTDYGGVNVYVAGIDSTYIVQFDSLGKRSVKIQEHGHFGTGETGLPHSFYTHYSINPKGDKLVLHYISKVNNASYDRVLIANVNSKSGEIYNSKLLYDSIRTSSHPWKPIFSSSGEFLYFRIKMWCQYSLIEEKIIQIQKNYTTDQISNDGDVLLGPNGKFYTIVSLEASGESSMRIANHPNIRGNGLYTTIVKNWADRSWPIGVNLPNISKFWYKTRPQRAWVRFEAGTACKNYIWKLKNTSDSGYFSAFTLFVNNKDSMSVGMPGSVTNIHFDKSGKYELKLRGMGAFGTLWCTDTIEVEESPQPKIELDSSLGCQWVAYKFTDKSIFPKNSKDYTWTWSFGDGTDTSLKSTKPTMPGNGIITHTYHNSGLYKISLIVKNEKCTDTFTLNNNITILSAPKPGIAITASKNCTPLTVEFSRQFSDPVDSIFWVLQKQTESKYFTKPIVLDTIKQGGTYSVTQVLYGSTGCVVIDSTNIHFKQGLTEQSIPIIKLASLVSNRKVFIYWHKINHTTSYNVLLNGNYFANTPDTSIVVTFDADITSSLNWNIVPIDSCNDKGSISITTKTIYAEAKADLNTDAAIITWNRYEYWPEGVKEYHILTRNENNNIWDKTINASDTFFLDNNFKVIGGSGKCYKITATSYSGEISISNEVCLNYPLLIFVPSAITPNNDGLNDNFDLVNYGFENYTYSIINSWGEILYKGNGIWQPDSKLPSGVYVVSIIGYSKGKQYNFSSTLHVLK